ncbi:MULTISPECIES: hypothetical protein [unclassified Agarivorans]|uniref:hypothetical protein n=1 Tax=unclassified Agarivorans TaxID=2636026 RepID=UPI003D7DF010
MIIKPIYEILPSLYLTAGSGSVIWLDSTLGIAGGILLFCLGAIVWVMRSNCRRLDEVTTLSKRITLPESLYEFTPFFLIGIALSLISSQQHIWAYILAVFCLYRGTQLLYLRHRYRSYAWQKAQSSSVANKRAQP